MVRLWSVNEHTSTKGPGKVILQMEMQDNDIQSFTQLTDVDDSLIPHAFLA